MERQAALLRPLQRRPSRAQTQAGGSMPSAGCGAGPSLLCPSCRCKVSSSSHWLAPSHSAIPVGQVQRRALQWLTGRVLSRHLQGTGPAKVLTHMQGQDGSLFYNHPCRDGMRARPQGAGNSGLWNRTLPPCLPAQCGFIYFYFKICFYCPASVDQC